MAKSKFEIDVDFQQAMQQAKKVREIAEQMKQAANTQFADNISQISSSWTGENATQYLNKCTQLKEKMAKSANKLSKTADTIETIAKNIYNAEMQAIQTASK